MLRENSQIRRAFWRGERRVRTSCGHVCPCQTTLSIVDNYMEDKQMTIATIKALERRGVQVKISDVSSVPA